MHHKKGWSLPTFGLVGCGLSAYSLGMKRLVVLGVLSGLLMTVASPVKAEVQRATWDMAQLPTLSTEQTRALFGFTTLSTIQDDHSWSTEIGSTNSFQSVLAPCANFPKIDMNYTSCIESVSYRKIGSASWLTSDLSKVQLGEPTTTIVKGKLTVGKLAYDPITGRPDGDKATFWSMPKAPHVGGSDYMLRARFIGSSTQSLQLTFKSELLPITYPTNSGTVTQDKLLVQEFPSDIEYKVRLRMGVFIKTLTGWFFGRLNSPTIDRNGPQGYLEIIGTPAFVPIGITDVVESANADQYFEPTWCAEVRQQLKTACGNMNKLFGKAVPFNPEDGWGPDSLSRWEAAPGGVKTVATLSYWSLTSSFWSSTAATSDTSQCAAQLYGASARVFQGAVFSNASLFQISPPSWDESNKSFVFKVAAPHLDKNGDLNKGSYTLYIPTEMAKCRWGDAVSSARAEVQIVNSDGKTSVTTLAATTENGNLRFNIAGFSYSSPTIKIRMGKDIKAPIAEVVAKKLIAIKCVKGKTVKKVVGVKPVCPSGYKKVAV